MAITRGRNFIRLTEASDAVTGIMHVTTIVFTVDGSNGGLLDLKNDAGTYILRVRLGTTAEGGPTTLAVPFNNSMDGVELDSIPTGGFVTIFTK